MKARLVFWHKAQLQNRYVLEMTIHDVGRSRSYPDGIKYRLILFDRESRRRVLMDNHSPKGHHVHLDLKEEPYTFIDDNTLFEDFKRLVLNHVGITL